MLQLLFLSYISATYLFFCFILILPVNSMFNDQNKQLLKCALYLLTTQTTMLYLILRRCLDQLCQNQFNCDCPYITGTLYCIDTPQSFEIGFFPNSVFFLNPLLAAVHTSSYFPSVLTGN